MTDRNNGELLRVAQLNLRDRRSYMLNQSGGMSVMDRLAKRMDNRRRVADFVEDDSGGSSDPSVTRLPDIIGGDEDNLSAEDRALLLDANTRP